MKLAYLHEARYSGGKYEDKYTFRFTGTHEFMERRDVQQLFSAFKVDKVDKHEHHTTFVLWIPQRDAGKIHHVLDAIVEKNYPDDWKPQEGKHSMYDGYARVKTDRFDHETSLQQQAEWHDHR